MGHLRGKEKNGKRLRANVTPFSYIFVFKQPGVRMCVRQTKFPGESEIYFLLRGNGTNLFCGGCGRKNAFSGAVWRFLVRVYLFLLLELGIGQNKDYLFE